MERQGTTKFACFERSWYYFREFLLVRGSCTRLGEKNEMKKFDNFGVVLVLNGNLTSGISLLYVC